MCYISDWTSKINNYWAKALFNLLHWQNSGSATEEWKEKETQIGWRRCGEQEEQGGRHSRNIKELWCWRAHMFQPNYMCFLIYSSSHINRQMRKPKQVNIVKTSIFLPSLRMCVLINIHITYLQHISKYTSLSPTSTVSHPTVSPLPSIHFCSSIILYLSLVHFHMTL